MFGNYVFFNRQLTFQWVLNCSPSNQLISILAVVRFYIWATPGFATDKQTAYTWVHDS